MTSPVDEREAVAARYAEHLTDSDLLALAGGRREQAAAAAGAAQPGAGPAGPAAGGRRAADRPGRRARAVHLRLAVPGLRGRAAPDRLRARRDLVRDRPHRPAQPAAGLRRPPAGRVRDGAAAPAVPGRAAGLVRPDHDRHDVRADHPGLAPAPLGRAGPAPAGRPPRGGPGRGPPGRLAPDRRRRAVPGRRLPEYVENVLGLVEVARLQRATGLRLRGADGPVPQLLEELAARAYERVGAAVPPGVVEAPGTPARVLTLVADRYLSPATPDWLAAPGR